MNLQLLHNEFSNKWGHELSRNLRREDCVSALDSARLSVVSLQHLDRYRGVGASIFACFFTENEDPNAASTPIE